MQLFLCIANALLEEQAQLDEPALRGRAAADWAEDCARYDGATRGLGRFVALHHRSSTSYQLR